MRTQQQRNIRNAYYFEDMLTLGLAYTQHTDTESREELRRLALENDDCHELDCRGMPIVKIVAIREGLLAMLADFRTGIPDCTPFRPSTELTLRRIDNAARYVSRFLSI